MTHGEVTKVRTTHLEIFDEPTHNVRREHLDVEHDLDVVNQQLDASQGRCDDKVRLLFDNQVLLVFVLVLSVSTRAVSTAVNDGKGGALVRIVRGGRGGKGRSRWVGKGGRRGRDQEEFERVRDGGLDEKADSVLLFGGGVDSCPEFVLDKAGGGGNSLGVVA
jgi:hypothetical protein